MSDQQQDDPGPDECDGLFYGAHIVVACRECGTECEGDVVNPSPEIPGFVFLDGYVACPTCSARTGSPKGVPVVVLVGEEVYLVDEEEEAPIDAGPEALMLAGDRVVGRPEPVEDDDPIP